MTEPMMMGSPLSPGSLASVSHGHIPSLPAYLMGEPATVPTSPVGRMWSASGSPLKASFGKGFISPSQQNISYTDKASFSEPQYRNAVASPSKGSKACAPPVTGLLEDLNISATCIQDASRTTDFVGSPNDDHPFNTTAHLLKTSIGVGRQSMSGQASESQMPRTQPSPAQRDPFYLQGETIGTDDVLDETWVTVFGFPPVATSFILQQFSQYGSIVKHVVSTVGNWMHIRYQAKLQARKALSKNGKVFGGTIMVGVIPCIDKLAMEGDVDSIHDTAANTSVFHTPKKNVGTSDAANTSVSIRPLTAAYTAASNDHDVQQTSNTPQKSNNVLSKAVEYVFGW